MTREERARQFLPFDAMKGLQEALRDREERHSRVEKHEITEEAIEENSKVLQHLEHGDTVRVSYYRAFHDVEKTGVATAINLSFKSFKVDNEKIYFDDLYSVEIVNKSADMSHQ